MKNKWVVILRVLLGFVFLISGLEKTLSPYENFLYIVQGYEILPGVLARLVAFIFPWVELVIGVFLVLGLWIPIVLRILLIVTLGFIFFVSQALERGLALTNCGCFGDLIHFPLDKILIFDSVQLALTFVCLKYQTEARRFSLDSVYDKK